MKNPKCPSCKGFTIRHGNTEAGTVRLKCKSCHKTFVETYTYQAYQKNTNDWIQNLVKEGSGIRSISRLLKIACNTVLTRIVCIADSIAKPVIATGKRYEVDELCTFCKSKHQEVWVVYALQRKTNVVADYDDAYTIFSSTASAGTN